MPISPNSLAEQIAQTLKCGALELWNCICCCLFSELQFGLCEQVVKGTICDIHLIGLHKNQILLCTEPVMS